VASAGTLFGFVCTDEMAKPKGELPSPGLAEEELAKLRKPLLAISSSL
jgi:hypothetical protein